MGPYWSIIINESPCFIHIFHISSFLPNVLFLFHNPIQDTIHSVVTFLQASLAVIISQSSLVWMTLTGILWNIPQLGFVSCFSHDESWVGFFEERNHSDKVFSSHDYQHDYQRVDADFDKLAGIMFVRFPQ